MRVFLFSDKRDLISGMPVVSSSTAPATPAVASRKLAAHVRRLLLCRRCPRMHPPVVSGGPVPSQVILVGQAPGDKEPIAGKPFAWTAGKTLFRWFEESCGLNEAAFRASIYMAAVCRCFPGKNPAGGDRVPAPDEVANCSSWLKREIEILQPRLILPVGKLAIQQFIPGGRLDEVVGKQFTVKFWIRNRPGIFCCDIIPLPHPSGASPWHRVPPGKDLLFRALRLVATHPAMPRCSHPAAS